MAAPFLLFCEAALSFTDPGLWRSDHRFSPFPTSEVVVSIPSPSGISARKQATTVAAEESPRLVTTHGSCKAFCPCCGVSRDHASRECHPGGPAKLDEHLLVPFREGDVPSGTVWQRAVVKRVTWGHLAASPEEVADRPARHRALHSDVRVVVLKGIANTKVSEWSIALAEAAAVATTRSDSTTDHASCTVGMAQLSNAFWKKLSAVFLPHVVHEAVVGGCFVSGGIWTALRAPKVFFGLLFRSRLRRSLLELSIVNGGGAGRKASVAGGSETCRF